MKNNKSFMAITVGKESSESTFKLYKGLAALNILSVNPTKAELSNILGKEIEEEPEYLSKSEDGKTQVKLTFWARTASEAKVNNGINLVVPINFILTKDTRVGQASGKYQIIDKYGRTAWGTVEEVQAKSIPQYSSGPANISPDYRLAWQGEDLLIDFLIQWLNIPGPASYKNGTWVMRDNLEDSEVSPDIEALFRGDFRELKSLVSSAPFHIVKGSVGINTVTNEDGTRQYQTVFRRKFLKNAVTDYSKLDATIAEFQKAGGAPTTEYSTQPLHENVVEATSFLDPLSPSSENTTPSETPWG